MQAQLQEENEMVTRENIQLKRKLEKQKAQFLDSVSTMKKLKK